ncbi:MAG TPA: amino acid adenylation domain-containing protein, partial [Bacteroidetes bacterium]|nr:amino acid adenylation domain-containing protein [Bacteroidota bacterium]
LIGTPFANRNRLEVENLIGFLNNTLVMRAQLRDEMTFVELLRVVYQTSMEAFANKDIPFETLVNTLKPDRSISTNPLFQTMFLFHHALPVPAFAPGLQMEHAPFDLGVAKFDLTLYLAESNGQLTTIFEYAKDLFQRSTVERMQGHLKTLLEAIAENPNQKMAELPLLTNDEKKRLLTDWNNTRRAAPQDVPIHYFIENQAREQPDKIAVAAQGQHLSYFDLNKKAEQLAARLQAIGVGKNVPVGLFTGRSVKMITGILAILKTGGAYLPIDPDYPKDRIAFLLEDAAVKIILAQPHLLDRLPATTAQVVSLDEKTHRSFVPEEVAPDDLAYIIYTSGSTGRPKGVQVTHRNLVHSTTARLHFYPQSPGTFLLLSSFSFDSSVAGIFWTLCSGGQLLLPPQHIEQDPDQLATLVFENKVTHTLLLPSLYSLLLQHAPAEKLTSLHTVIVAGEACPVGLPKRHFDKIPNASLFNEYGPTEATVWCTAFQILKEEATAPIPIGRPIPNTEIYILDKNKQPVPIGVPGELYVGGAGVTKGYLNRPQLTNQRFIAPPKWLNTQHFPQGPGTPKLYRTGDLARYRPDGQIEFLGRTDQQVKIRGYRIEPEEIKKVLEQLEEVGEAAVVVQTIQENGMEKNGIERLLEALLSLNPDEADRLLSSIEQLNTNP